MTAFAVPAFRSFATVCLRFQESFLRQAPANRKGYMLGLTIRLYAVPWDQGCWLSLHISQKFDSFVPV